MGAYTGYVFSYFYLSSLQQVKQFVDLLLRGVTSENSDVRTHALMRLRKTLVQQQNVIHQLVLSGETVDPVITKIIATVSFICDTPSYVSTPASLP